MAGLAGLASPVADEAAIRGNSMKFEALGGSGRHLGASGRLLGGIWRHLGGIGRLLGGIWRHLGPPGATPGGENRDVGG